jgi:Tfp pilus assembly protein PilX
MTHHKFNQQKQSGIALLMTILVLGVVLSVTLAMVELSMQQLALSVDTKDSEIAFHAANAGLECARYMRRHASSSFEKGITPITPLCFGTTTPVIRRVAAGSEGIVTTGAEGYSNVYRYKVSLASGINRCSVIDMITMVVQSSSTDDLVMTAPSGNLADVLPGYGADRKRCAPGAVCTVAVVAGYNALCNGITADGVLKRQVLLEF